MSDQPKLQKPAIAPSAQQLIDSATRLKSHALHVSTTRLIQESRHLRETNERRMKEAEQLRKTTPRKKPRNDHNR